MLCLRLLAYDPSCLPVANSSGPHLQAIQLLPFFYGIGPQGSVMQMYVELPGSVT